MRRVLGAAALLVALGTPAAALADAGELWLGLWGGMTVPLEGRGGAVADFGLTDWLALRARAGGGADENRRGVALGYGQAVLSLDVREWVPEAAIGGGFRGTARPDRFEARALLTASLGIKRFLSRKWVVGFEAGAEWRTRSDWAAAFHLSVWRRFR